MWSKCSNADELQCLERGLEIPRPSGQQFPSVLVPLSRVFTEVLYELVLVPIVIEEIVSMPVRVLEIGRTLPVSVSYTHLTLPTLLLV